MVKNIVPPTLLRESNWSDVELEKLWPCTHALNWRGCPDFFFHSKARGMVEKGSMGAVLSMAWAVAKQLAAVSLSPSIDSITRPRLYQDTWSVGSSLRIFFQFQDQDMNLIDMDSNLMAALRASSPRRGLPSFKWSRPSDWRLAKCLG